jgi:hypothetical protein
MKSNPCLQCQLGNQDKNNQMCMSCHKRIDYVNHLDRELNFVMTNTGERSQSPPVSTLPKRSYLLSAASGNN